MQARDDPELRARVRAELMQARPAMLEVEPGVVCDACARCGEQCPPSPNDALCWKCAKELRDAQAA